MKKIIFLLFIIDIIESYNKFIQPEAEIIKKILKNYDTRARPIFDSKKTLNIIYQMSLIEIQDVDARHQQIR